MATIVMSSLSLKPFGFRAEKVRGLPSLSRPSTSFKVMASGVKKITTDKPYGVNGGMNLGREVDSSSRKGKGKGVYQYVDKYVANVDGYRYELAMAKAVGLAEHDKYSRRSSKTPRDNANPSPGGRSYDDQYLGQSSGV